MKLIEAINRLDVLKFNTYNQSEKINWLSRLDSMVKKQIIDTHEGSESVFFEEYTDDTPLDTVLLVPAPYDEVYLRWMEAQIDYNNGEIDRYNISISMFNTEYEAFENWYRRNHMPVSKGRFVF